MTDLEKRWNQVAARLGAVGSEFVDEPEAVERFIKRKFKWCESLGAAKVTSVLKMGVGYTIATGRLFCTFDDLYKAARVLMGRPVFTHEFGSANTWEALRHILEEEILKELETERSPE